MSRPSSKKLERGELSRVRAMRCSSRLVLTEATTPSPAPEKMRPAECLLAERMLTVAEVADHYRFTPRTIRNWIKDGAIQAVRIGRSIRIPETALRDFDEKPWI